MTTHVISDVVSSVRGNEAEADIPLAIYDVCAYAQAVSLEMQAECTMDLPDPELLPTLEYDWELRDVSEYGNPVIGSRTTGTARTTINADRPLVARHLYRLRVRVRPHSGSPDYSERTHFFTPRG